MTEIPRRFVIVCSLPRDNATVRLQSLPIFRGLTMQGADAKLFNPDIKPLEIGPSSWAIFHYADKAALAALRMQRRKNFRGICLASDIYRYEEYQALLDLADLFIVPTESHRRILAAGISRPVFTVPECIDPAALEDTQEVAARAPGAPPRLFWFGYSESFDKGMASLVPVIQRNLAQGRIGCFDLILDQENFNNRFGLTTRSYEARTFRSTASRYDYTILSHFALDLHVNSLIKSPNKAIAALMAGIIPLATDTPNYGELFRRLGLERFLFSSAGELNNLLRTLDPRDDADLIIRNRVRERLMDWYSEAALFEAFLAAIKNYKVEEDLALIAPWSIAPTPSPPPSCLTIFKRYLVRSYK